MVSLLKDVCSETSFFSRDGFLFEGCLRRNAHVDPCLKDVSGETLILSSGEIDRDRLDPLDAKAGRSTNRVCDFPFHFPNGCLTRNAHFESWWLDV